MIIDRNYFFGKFDIKRAKHAGEVADYLYKNSYIFDKNSPYYLNDKEIRKLVKLKMQTNSYKNMDLKAYILELKKK